MQLNQHQYQDRRADTLRFYAQLLYLAGLLDRWNKADQLWPWKTAGTVYPEGWRMPPRRSPVNAAENLAHVITEISSAQAMATTMPRNDLMLAIKAALFTASLDVSGLEEVEDWLRSSGQRKLAVSAVKDAIKGAFESSYAPLRDFAARLAVLAEEGDETPENLAFLASQNGHQDPSQDALTPKEQAFLDELNDEGQTGPDILAKLARRGIGFDKSAISTMSKRPQMIARGVRHRHGAGYYRVKVNSTI